MGASSPRRTLRNRQPGSQDWRAGSCPAGVGEAVAEGELCMCTRAGGWGVPTCSSQQPKAEEGQEFQGSLGYIMRTCWNKWSGWTGKADPGFLWEQQPVMEGSEGWSHPRILRCSGKGYRSCSQKLSFMS